MQQIVLKERKRVIQGLESQIAKLTSEGGHEKEELVRVKQLELLQANAFLN